MFLALSVSTLSFFTLPLAAQRSVPAEVMYHRVLAVVPIIGSGTADDPRRPMLTPSPGEMKAFSQADARKRPDILGYQMQLSDNGKFAIVEFVFSSPAAYSRTLKQAAASLTNRPQQITGSVDTSVLFAVANAADSDDRTEASRSSGRKAALENAIPGVKLFERGKDAESDILTALRKQKANFTFDDTVRPQ
jgi:hypothetical protein